MATAMVLGALAWVGGWPLYMIGFSSTGPVAGTVASGMMSSTAIAAGGAVAKGTTVALLQSAAMGGATGIAATIGGAATAVVGSAGWLIACVL